MTQKTTQDEWFAPSRTRWCTPEASATARRRHARARVCSPPFRSGARRGGATAPPSLPSPLRVRWERTAGRGARWVAPHGPARFAGHAGHPPAHGWPSPPGVSPQPPAPRSMVGAPAPAPATSHPLSHRASRPLRPAVVGMESPCHRCRCPPPSSLLTANAGDRDGRGAELPPRRPPAPLSDGLADRGGVLSPHRAGSTVAVLVGGATRCGPVRCVRRRRRPSPPASRVWRGGAGRRRDPPLTLPPAALRTMTRARPPPFQAEYQIR